MKNQSRTDRIVVLLALAILFMAGGFFYFDSWMWGTRKDRGETIGRITARTGDVRHRFDGDLKWQKAASGEDLVYNDAVFAGAGSQADLKIGESKMTVTENTLVVLRRDNQVNFLNLSYGSLLGKIAKNDKVVIDSGDGKPIELDAKSDAQIVLRRVNGKTQLDVTSGIAQVTVNGKKSLLQTSNRLTMADKPEFSKIEEGKLRLVKPSSDEVVFSAAPTNLEFVWALENGRIPRADDRYALEFSNTADFRALHATKIVQGALKTSMRASESLSLFVRVRGPGGETSQTEKVNFVRLHAPVIVKPQAGFRYQNPPGVPTVADFEIQRDPKASIWYQVARDVNFNDVVINRGTSDARTVNDLPPGEYFMRARADYGNARVSDWTPVTPFAVDTSLRISERTPPEKVLIPNRSYPPDLYNAKPERVRAYLASRGFLSDFFPFEKSTFDDIQLAFDGEEKIISQKSTAWPTEKLAPARHKYRYQTAKNGATTPWSEPRKLEIEMEPPRPVGEAAYGELGADNQRPAQWNFTPLLFARSYDIEVARDLSFRSALELKTNSSQIQTKLPQGSEYYWRARARDRQGRIISAFSQPYRLKPMPQVPQFLAKNEADRKPSAVEDEKSRSRSRVERLREEPWEANGWWTWVGAGSNFVDYRQSIDRGTLTSQNIRAVPSQYIEAGFTGNNGWGGVLSYKNTPGEMLFNNATISPATYTWSTMGLEGILRKTAPFSVLGKPVFYGLRLGVQQHRMPFVFLDAGAELSLRQNEMTNASFGFLAEQIRKRWTYYWLMRYQFPVTSAAVSAQRFELTPTFGFDGSIGTSYNITQQFKVGFFWYGQWHQFNFVYADDEITNAGFQSIFYSNFDFRLGFDF